MEKACGDDYRPSFVKIEDSTVKDPIAEYILAKPEEGQIKDITHRMMKAVGNMCPIPDQEIKKYIGRIIKSMNSEQKNDAIQKTESYVLKIKSKIRQLADSYAEARFMDLIKSIRINTKGNWNLS